MPLSGLNAVGKSLLAVAGMAYGFHRGFATPHATLPVEPVPYRPSAEDTPPQDKLEALASRVASLEKALAETRPPSSWEVDRSGAVSHRELAEIIDRTTARINRDVDRKFEVQSLSIGSLRVLIRQTDQLLEKVLVNLEAAGPEE